ncbi:uncharacterized protein LOC110675235 [Aedes aegypti]|uniref:Uncharacterized protein n=1 Tax=Aedes aegypti TaxID=7159 RepID=A0A6I8TRW8_AEDAE|nr:uncharacterized protein LOC110675235 [Aedes aegypti]
MESHKFVRAPTESGSADYDNGAEGSRTTSDQERTNSKSKKISRRKLMEELIALKTELVLARAERDQLLREKEIGDKGVDLSSPSEDSNDHPKSENESLMVTMNHMSLARTCSVVARQGIGQKRARSGADEDEPRPKLAAITQNGEDKEEAAQDFVKVE